MFQKVVFLLLDVGLSQLTSLKFIQRYVAGFKS